jgi:YVTN family beta-propeller protein
VSFFCGTNNLIYSYIGPDGIGSYWIYQNSGVDNKGVETDAGGGFQGWCYTPYISDASTRFAILGQLPPTLTLTGEAPFSTTYGMPLLYVNDGNNNVVATETATSVSRDSSQAIFPFPSNLRQNLYSVAVANQINSSPGISAVGTNYLSIASSQTITGNPFGVDAAAYSTMTVSCTMITPPYPGVPPYKNCQTSSSNNAFPVVSLYSQNQVLANGTRINVGANPTAVIAYYNGDIVNTSWDGLTTQTITGTSRAIVANSGSNTVSILDIVNNEVLFNVHVGNQPVALTVSSGGSTAYVANYTDSTVTQVNLNSGTATATVAVGGHPTSVALTAAGTLWVGGVGFLTQMNAQPMSVVATVPVANKSISALGFSNSEKQLVATTIDTNSNVYVDEINPTTIQAGSAYTPIASKLVSGLGTHLLNRTNTQVRAFTATLTNSNLISANQIGAPPLVVQDGWAVVTATPTGFSITDITGQVVLVSETTPSPVTAIAVDSKLNVAYLVMPDSNTLLTVPLPGTN